MRSNLVSSRRGKSPVMRAGQISGRSLFRPAVALLLVAAASVADAFGLPAVSPALTLRGASLHPTAAAAPRRLALGLRTRQERVAAPLGGLKAESSNDSPSAASGMALYRAAEAGDLDKVKDLLEAGANKDAAIPEKQGETALHAAICYSHSDVVTHLITSGANVNAAMSEGETPLHVACFMGSADIVRELLEAGAGADAVLMGEGDTPLYIAARYGHTEVVKALLKGGADKDASLSAGETPLHIAAYGGHIEVVKELISAGADKTATDAGGKTAQEVATRFKRTEIAELLA